MSGKSRLRYRQNSFGLVDYAFLSAGEVLLGQYLDRRYDKIKGGSIALSYPQLIRNSFMRTQLLRSRSGHNSSVYAQLTCLLGMLVHKGY